MKKYTPEEVYQAYNNAQASLPPEGQAMLTALPENFEELTEEQQAAINDLTWRVNLVLGELSED